MSAATFRATAAEDPHIARRRAILRAHPEVRALLGPDRWTALRAALAIAGHVGLSFGFARLQSLPALALGAWLIGGFAAKFLGVVIHECAHDLVFRSRTANRLLALAVNLPLLAPGAIAFRRLHHQHHNRMGVAGVDNDLPALEELRRAPTSAAGKLLWLAIFPLVVTPVRARHFPVRTDRWVLANLLLQAAATILFGLLLGWRALLYLSLSGIFGFGLHPSSTHMLYEHSGSPGDQETWSYYGALNHLTLNLGHHVEHHDFQRVPGSRLPSLRRIAPEFYRPLASSRSWPAIFARFLFQRDVGYHQRMVRP